MAESKDPKSGIPDSIDLYYKEYFNIQTHLNYLVISQRSDNRYDKIFKGIVALASVSSLGTWAVFKDYPFIFATIIVFAQCVTAVTPYFPWEKRLSAYPAVISEYSSLAMKAYETWYLVSSGQLTEDEINKERIGIVRQQHQILESLAKDIIFPKSGKKRDLAESEARDFFEKYYES